jgi:hypothetical protein
MRKNVKSEDLPVYGKSEDASCGQPIIQNAGLIPSHLYGAGSASNFLMTVSR